MQKISHDQQVTLRSKWTIIHHYRIEDKYFWHSLYVTRKWIQFCRLSYVLDNKRSISKNNNICVGINFCRWLGGVFIYTSCCNIIHSNYIRVGLQDTPTISWFKMEGDPGGPSTEIRFLMDLDNSSKFHCRNHCVILRIFISLGGLIATTKTYQIFTDLISNSIILFYLVLRFIWRGFE